MAVVNIEPIITHRLLASKLTLRFPDAEGDTNDGINILINCGWSLDFNEGDLEAYKRISNDIDLVLITDGDFEHTGALLWLLSTFKTHKSAKYSKYCYPTILSTEASYKFTRAALIDVLENVSFTNKFEYYGVKDLEDFHKNCSKLRYKETYYYSKRINGTNIRIACHPINNGCSIGGALWIIDIGLNSIVCGDDFRMNSSVLLNPVDFDSLTRPDVLIINHESNKNKDKESFKYRGREKLYQFYDLDILINKILVTLSDGGSILIPSDIDHTLINLLVTLNFVWSTTNLSHYKIVLVSPVADKILLLVGTCLEYMKSNLYHNFIKTLWNPLQNINHITPLTSLSLLSKYQYAPTIFISTCNSINFGFTSFLFVSLAAYYKNLIILSKPIDDILKFAPNANEAGMHSEYGDVEKPSFILQLNLKSNASDSINVKTVLRNEVNLAEDSKVGLKDTEPTSFHNFVNIHGKPTFLNHKNLSSAKPDYFDKKNEDYGLTFSDSVNSTNMNPYNRLDTNAVDETAQSHTTELDSKDYLQYNSMSVMDDYYRKYLEIKTKDQSLFDIENELTSTHTHKTREKPQIIVKTLPFVLKCQVYLTSCFNYPPNDLQIPSFLHHISPRHAFLFPRGGISDKNTQIETYISKFKHCSLFHSFGNKCTIYAEMGCGSSQFSTTDDKVSLVLDTFNFPMKLDDNIIVLLRSIIDSSRIRNFEKPTRNAKYEKVGSVIKSINLWKSKHNKQKICQILGRLEVTENVSHEVVSTTSSGSLHCKTFWSEKTDNMSKIVFNIDSDSGDSKDVKMGLCKTQLVGNINMSTYTSFMDGCVPNYISVYSGIANVNQKVKVTKNILGYGRKGWIMEGTLDPSYYLARKILYKLHSKIEPIY